MRLLSSRIVYHKNCCRLVCSKRKELKCQTEQAKHRKYNFVKLYLTLCVMLYVMQHNEICILSFWFYNLRGKNLVFSRTFFAPLVLLKMNWLQSKVIWFKYANLLWLLSKTAMTHHDIRYQHQHWIFLKWQIEMWRLRHYKQTFR